MPVTNKENSLMNQTRTTTTTTIRGRIIFRRGPGPDLDESAESRASEIEENEDQPVLFDQVILSLEDWQSQFLVRS